MSVSIFYLKSNVDKIQKFRAKIPEDIYIPLNIGRDQPRNNEIRGVFGKNAPDNYSVSLKEWLQTKLDEGYFTINSGNIVTDIDFYIGSINVPAGSTFNTLIQTIINSIGGASNDKNFVYAQISPDTVWDITHGMGKYPSVQVVDSSSNVILPDIQFIDPNNIRLTFNTPTTGTVYLN
ncbi:MAG: hypothetical protein KatS3mg087_2212 [Patescibacteria group bacterium]|nr:MAG: hypothetical protein KatS3mg087_2212 [Patescibacteria group bacterium]